MHRWSGEPWPAWLRPFNTVTFTLSQPYEITDLERYKDHDQTFWSYDVGGVTSNNGNRVIMEFFSDSGFANLTRQIGFFTRGGESVKPVVLRQDEVAVRIRTANNNQSHALTLLIPRKR